MKNRREFIANSARIVGVISVAGFVPLWADSPESNADPKDSAQDSKQDSRKSNANSHNDSHHLHHKWRNIFIYYTRTLNTHILVQYLQSLIGGYLARIQTAQNYPKDYQQLVELSAQQSADGIFPPLQPHTLNLRGYDNIFIATPLWNGDICPPIKSFLRSANFGDRAISLIITSAGFGLGVSVDSAKKLVSVGAVLDYKFNDYEKILPNLRTINESKIAQNRAYDALDKDKIANFLARI